MSLLAKLLIEAIPAADRCKRCKGSGILSGFLGRDNYCDRCDGSGREPVYGKSGPV